MNTFNCRVSFGTRPTALIRFSSDGKKCNEFESIVAEYFRFIGYAINYLGQGKGRVTDLLAKYIHPSIYPKSYAVIIDAKATSSKYKFPVSDKRKMIKYIEKHGPMLLKEKIPNHAFSFISCKFTEDVVGHLKEISNKTFIRGCTIDVESLLKLGHIIKNQKLKIENLFNRYTTNSSFSI